MIYWAWSLFAVYILAAFAVNTYFMVLWLEFVATVAKLEKREDELADYRSGDEGGFNAFEREQYKKLRQGLYRELNNPDLTALGDRLQSLQMLSIASILACFVIGIGAYYYTKP